MTSENADNTKVEKTEEPKKPKGKWASRLWRLFKWTGISLLLLISLILLLLVFFPINPIKDYALEEVESQTGINIDIGHMRFNVFSGLEINNVVVNPPEGYEKPVFTLKKFVLAYNPWKLLSDEFIIDQLSIQSPHVNIESKDGVLNVEALQKGLPKSEPKLEEPPEEPEEPKEPSEPSPFKITITQFELTQFSAWVDDGIRKVVFRFFDVATSGFFSEKNSKLDVVVRIHKGDSDTPNLTFSQTEPLPVDSELDVTLDVNVRAKDLLKAKADATVALYIQTKKLETQWPLDPISISTRVDAGVDMEGDWADLRSLKVTFNGEEILSLQAYLEGLIEQRKVRALLERLYLPLDVFQPYAKAFVKGVDFGGTVAIDALSVKGDVQKLLKQGLPEMEGTIITEKVWAKYQPAQASVKGINTKISLYSLPEEQSEGLEKPAINVAGDIHIDQAGAPQGQIKNLKLGFDARADGISPSQTRLGLDLSIGEAAAMDPSIGEAKVTLSTHLKASADFPTPGLFTTGVFRLDRLSVNVSDTVEFDVSAEATGDAGSQNFEKVAAEFNLKPINLKRAIALIPSEIKKKIPAMDISGDVGLQAKVSSGPINGIPKDPMTLPVKLDSTLALNKIGVVYPDQKLSVHAFDGAIHISGSPKDLSVDGELGVKGVEKTDLTLSVADIKIPIQARYRKSATDLQTGVSVGSVLMPSQALDVSQTNLTVTAQILGDAIKQQFSLLSGDIRLDVDNVQYAKALMVKVAKPSVSVDFAYYQDKKSGQFGFGVGVDSVDIPEQKTTVSGFAFKMDTKVEGVDMPIIPNPDQHAELAWLNVKMDIDSIEKRDVFPEPLVGTNFRMKSLMKDMRDADLETLSFSIPGLGTRLDMKGKAWNVLQADGSFPNYKNIWPEFDVELFAGLDNSTRRQLIAGLETSGLAGMKARARSLPGNFAKLEGRIAAKDFHLWQKSHGELKNEDGTTTPIATELHINDFDADVPLIQMIDLENIGQVITPKTSIFEQSARNVLYDTMRPYLAQRSNFHIDGISLKQKKGISERELKIDEIALDMIYSDGTFAIDRLYVGLLGGGITGSLQAQLVSLPPDPLDVRLHFENQVTGVNLALLTKDDPSQVTAETEISSLITLNFGLQDQYIEGGLDITKLSLKQLDEVLKFLDPSGQDPNVQKNRDVINSWYVDMVNPKVKLVSAWINYSNANVDIALDAIWPFGELLNKYLANNRIRRIDIKPKIRQAYLMMGLINKDQKVQTEEQPSGSADGGN